MKQLTCPGLPASWVNAWLAGLGATVVDRRIRLHWTERGAPVAVLSAVDIHPLDALVESWPDRGALGTLPLAEHWNGAGRLKRKVSVEAFAERVRAARGNRQSWTLSSTMTDLSVDNRGEVAHAPFDPAGPGTIKWLHHRVMRTHGQIGASTRSGVRRSLAGQSDRVKGNGLGFDQTRLGSLADETEMWIDPVIEVLAFFGLAILPMRGLGQDRRIDRRANIDDRQRGWRRSPGSSDPRRFAWPAWAYPLGVHGIDALLDAWNPHRRQTWPLLGVHAGWQSIRYEPRARADTTRAIGAEPL